MNKLTQEQSKVVSSKKDVIVNSVAGSGKTTTLIEYAKARPKSRILYLAFNKSVKTEAIEKFAEANVTNVIVETAHSLAYKNIVRKYNYKVRDKYKLSDLLKDVNVPHNNISIAIAVHVKKFIAYFCNSKESSVKKLNYLDIVTDKKAKVFVKKHYANIEAYTRSILAKMDKAEIEITHDFYLKKFQLSNPILDYHYILFDEGQDACPAMLDVFLSQNATKVIVGDTHQQIYSWRFAINSLEICKFNTLSLSTSFRFPQPIAELANTILSWKFSIKKYPIIKIFGAGSSQEKKTKAILARTGVSLLLKAIKYIDDFPKIYFEGGLNSYIYSENGASIYDVYSLYNNKHEYIKDETIRSMKDFNELLTYIESSEDNQLANIAEIVEKYTHHIPDLIRTLKENQVEKEEANVVYSTVHRAKGIEYDLVELADDFITEERIKNYIVNKELSVEQIIEEVNIFYVAITRAKNVLYIPKKYLPEDFKYCPHIVPILFKTQNPLVARKQVIPIDKSKVKYIPINNDDFYEFGQSKSKNRGRW